MVNAGMEGSLLKKHLKAGDARKSPVASVAVVLLFMYVVSGLLLLLLALLLYQAKPGEIVIRIGIILIYIITGATGGVLIAKKQKNRKFLWGLLVGITYFILLFGISVIVRKGADMDPVRSITALVLCAASGMIGGMIG